LNKKLTLMFVLLMVLDMDTTWLGFHYGAIEANPLWPIWAMPIVKLIAIGICLICLRYIHNNWPTLARWTLVGANIGMGFVVVSNATIDFTLATAH